MNVINQATDIVKRKWRSTGSGWKVALFTGLIILAILAIIALAIWLVGRSIKSITSGEFRNRDLYFAKVRRW